MDNINEFTPDEMRFYRRELINNCLHIENSQLAIIKEAVRFTEVRLYGSELKRYQ